MLKQSGIGKGRAGRRGPSCTISCWAVIVLLSSVTSACQAPEQSVAKPTPGSDSIVLPASRREFASPDGAFQLVVESADQWASKFPTARLLRGDQKQRVPLWERAMSQEYGPRAAVVANDGRVLFADEWINVTSHWALMLVDSTNNVVATHDYAAVVRALGVPEREVSNLARSGTWMTSGPTLSPDGSSAHFAAGGRTLVVSLADGALSVR